MKILLIDVNYKNSSTGKIVFDLKNEIEKNGHEAFVAFGRGKRVNEKNVFKFGNIFETLIDFAFTRVFGLVGYMNFFSTASLLKIINRIKPEVVHLHEIHSYFLNIPLLLKFLASKRLKVINTLHNEFPYTGKCWNTDGCEKFTYKCDKCPKLREYPKTYFFDHTAMMQREKIELYNKINNITFVSPSQWLIKNFSRSLLKSKNIVLIRNGIDTSIFDFNSDSNYIDKVVSNKIEKFKKTILFIASNPFSLNKGGTEFIELSKVFNDYFFILIGAETNIKNQFPNLAILSKINNPILLSNYYRVADCFVVLSKHENLPTTVIESLCSGLPVFGYRNKGNLELIDNNNGYLVDYGNLKALSKSIDDYFSGNIPSILPREKLSAESRIKYSKTKMFQEYFKIYFHS